MVDAFIPSGLFGSPIQDMEQAQQAMNKESNVRTGRPSGAIGVFGSVPFASPKFSKYLTNRKHEYFETMARMFIRVPNGATLKRERERLKTKELIDIFNVLCGVHPNETGEVLAGSKSVAGGVGYIDFLLHGVNHSLSEKLQVCETLSDNYVSYFFGQRAPMFQFTGSVLNTLQDDWAVRLYRLFQFFGRGTELARNGFVMRIKYDSFIVAGFMTDYSWSLNAASESVCPFSFNFLVKSIQVIGETFSKSTIVPGINTFYTESLARVGGTSRVKPSKPSTSEPVRALSSANETNNSNTNKNATEDKHAANQSAEAAALRAAEAKKTKDERINMEKIQAEELANSEDNSGSGSLFDLLF